MPRKKKELTPADFRKDLDKFLLKYKDLLKLQDDEYADIVFTRRKRTPAVIRAWRSLKGRLKND